MDRSSPRLSVVTYNIHKGFSALGRRFVLKGIREAIARLGSDVAFLQEVVGSHRGHARALEGWVAQPHAEYLASAHWPYIVYSRTREDHLGHHGNAILSKVPVLRWRPVNLTTNRMERRGLIHSVLAWPDARSRLHAICVHLGLTERGRRRQIARICDLVREGIPHHEPIVLAGDFNDWRTNVSRLLAEAGLVEAFEKTAGRAAATFPGRFPILPLDRIYVRGLEVEHAERPQGREWARLSDHAPIVARLRSLRA